MVLWRHVTGDTAGAMPRVSASPWSEFPHATDCGTPCQRVLQVQEIYKGLMEDGRGTW